MSRDFEWFTPAGSAVSYKLKVPTVFDEYEVSRLVTRRGGRTPTRAGFFATAKRALLEIMPDAGDPSRVRADRALGWKFANLEVSKDIEDEVAADFEELDRLLARNWPAYADLHADDEYARGMRAEEMVRYHVRAVAWAETEAGQAAKAKTEAPPFELELGLDGLMLDRCLAEVTIAERMLVIRWVQERLRPSRDMEKNLKSPSGTPSRPARSRAGNITRRKLPANKPSGKNRASGST